jgi:hypothetical protein
LAELGSDKEVLGVDATPAQLGGLHGKAPIEAVLSPWLAKQLVHGYYTYVKFSVLRRLSGLAERVWTYLEAERWTRKGVGKGRMTTWVKLGPITYDVFGMRYGNDRQARQALSRAGQRIVEADDKYESVRVTKQPGGYALHATRIEGVERRRVARLARESLASAMASAVAA